MRHYSKATPDDPYGTLSWRFSGPNRTFPAGCRKDRSRTPCLIGRFPHKDGGSLSRRQGLVLLFALHGARNNNNDNNKNENNELHKDGTHAETRSLGLGTTNCIYHLTPMPTTAFGTCDLTVAFCFPESLVCKCKSQVLKRRSTLPFPIQPNDNSGAVQAISPPVFSGESSVAWSGASAVTPKRLSSYGSRDDSSPRRGGGEDVSRGGHMLHHAYGGEKPPSNDDPYGLIQLGLTEHTVHSRPQAQDRCLVLHQRAAGGASTIPACYITARSYSPAIPGF